MSRTIPLTLLAMLAIGPTVAIADKLSDFREAVKNKGCESLPYSDYKSTCQSQQAPVHDAANKRLEQAIKDLEARGKLVSDAIYNLEKCIDYRRAVMNVFASAIDRVRNESDPPEIIPLARQLRDMWEAGKPGHEEQITARKNALDTCKSSRP